jgi:hypothetical protein
MKEYWNSGVKNPFREFFLFKTIPSNIHKQLVPSDHPIQQIQERHTGAHQIKFLRSLLSTNMNVSIHILVSRYIYIRDK